MWGRVRSFSVVASLRRISLSVSPVQLLLCFVLFPSFLNEPGTSLDVTSFLLTTTLLTLCANPFFLSLLRGTFFLRAKGRIFEFSKEATIFLLYLFVGGGRRGTC